MPANIQSHIQSQNQNVQSHTQRWDALTKEASEATLKRTKLQDKDHSVSPEKISQMKDVFASMLLEKVAQNSLLKENREIMTDILATLDTITENAFKDAKEDKLAFRTLVLKANNTARELQVLLDDMERSVESPEAKLPKLNITSKGEVNLLVKKPEVETMVLRGGGCKGLGYIETFKALAENGLLRGVKNVVGTSIGAITSMGIACGLNLTGGIDEALVELTEARKASDFLQHLYNPSQYALDHPKAKPISEEVKDRFRALPKADQDRLRQLAASPIKDKNQGNRQFTYQDMALMHRLDPRAFRDVSKDPRNLNVSQLGKLLADICTMKSSISASKFYASYPGYEKILPKTSLAGGLAAFKTLEFASAQGVSDYMQRLLYYDKNEYRLAHPGASPLSREVQDRFLALATKDQERLRFLAEPPQEGEDRSGRMVTFSDLAILHQLDPDTFKDLTITAWDSNAKEPLYLNVENVPDMPVALAARASMALPAAFGPVQYPVGNRNQPRVLRDGGLADNVPIHYALSKHLPQFSKEKISGKEQLSGEEQNALNETRAKVLAFTFDEGGKAYTNMAEGLRTNFSPNEFESFLTAWFGGQSRYGEALKLNYTQLRDHGLSNTLIVGTDKQDTASSSNAQNAGHRVSTNVSALAYALKYIDNRSNRAYTQTFKATDCAKSGRALAAKIPEGEKKALADWLVETYKKDHGGTAPADLTALKLFITGQETGANPSRLPEALLGAVFTFDGIDELGPAQHQAREILASLVEELAEAGPENR